MRLWDAPPAQAASLAQLRPERSGGLVNTIGPAWCRFQLQLCNDGSTSPLCHQKVYGLACGNTLQPCLAGGQGLFKLNMKAGLAIWQTKGFLV